VTTEGPKPRIVVVDYGAGNLRSVARALAAIGAEPRVTEDPKDLDSGDGLVFPGVGAAGAAMRGLTERKLVEPLRAYVASGRPFLGVCIGLQVLMSWSDEGDGVSCLGIIPGKVVHLPPGQKTPHIGWNQVHQIQPHPIFAGIPDEANFYFVHSYVTQPEDLAWKIGETSYGVSFCSALAYQNVVATQFHPEKSAADGLQVYRNFVEITTRRRVRSDRPALVSTGG
jgi:glutamine amidotransferase